MKTTQLMKTATRATQSLLLALALALVASTPALAQSRNTNKKEVQLGEVEDAKALTGDPEGLGGDRSRPDAVSAEDNFKKEKEFESAKKLDEQIVRIKKLIKITPENHPDRPQFLFNLAELYWSKAKFYYSKAYAKQDDCYELEDKAKSGDEKDVKAHKRCLVQMKDMLREVKRQREETVRLYVQIIQNHDNFKNMDEVYYYLGANLMEIGRRPDALNQFRDLVRKYPTSRFVPNVLVAFGDFAFDGDDMEEALKAYDRVTKNYKGSAVYGYATYKKAWCYFNLDNKKKALELFLETNAYAKKYPNLPNSRPLRRQSVKDIVMTYSFVGSADKAIKFFKKVTDDDREEWMKMTERLALFYSDKGKYSESISLYRKLITLNQESVKIVDYQLAIVRNEVNNNMYSKNTVGELVRLMIMVNCIDNDGQCPTFEALGQKKGKVLPIKDRDVPEKEYKKTRAGVERLAKTWAKTYHREAQQTRNADLYQNAYFLYMVYLDTFPDSKEAYDMTFFYGELLYKLKKFDEAAVAYEAAFQIDKKGKYTEEIVHASVSSYFRDIKVSEKKAKLVKGSDDVYQVASKEGEGPKKGKSKKAKKGPPEPKEFPQLQKDFIAACDRYIEFAPDGDQIVNVKYTRARTYYDFFHLKDAAAAFRQIVYDHPKHKLAIISANLHLASLEESQDYDALEAAVAEYRDKRPLDDKSFNADVTTMYSRIKFKKCTLFNDREQWDEGATCFVEFYRTFPGSPYIDKALYNAALNYERTYELSKAIRVRMFLLEAKPESDLAPITLFNVAANFHAIAVYSKAAQFYQLFVVNFPKHEKAEVALSNASTFLQGMGESEKAIAAYEKYLELFGKKKKDKGAEVFFQIAKIHEEEGKKRAAFEQYEQYLRKWAKYGTPDRRIQAHTAIGLFYWNRGGKSNRKKALAEFERTLKVYNKMPKSEQEKMREGRDAAAQAMFLIGEDAYEDLEKMKIDSRNNKELKKKLDKKVKKSKEVQKIYEQVILFGRPDWAIAALYRIGTSYENFANSLRQSPCPRKLTYDQCEIYKGLLEDNATQIETNAVTFYEKSLEAARQANWFNKYTKLSETRLAKIKPRQYRKPSELRAEPNHVQKGVGKVDFIKEINEDDALDDFQKKKESDEGEEGAQ